MLTMNRLKCRIAYGARGGEVSWMLKLQEELFFKLLMEWRISSRNKKSAHGPEKLLMEKKSASGVENLLLE